MAVNQLIAQGLRPIGADAPQIANMLAQRKQQEQQNALAQSELGIRQQNANLIANQQQAALAQREAEATKEQYGYAARVGYALSQAKTPEEFAMLADRVAADPQYQSIPGVFTREQMTPENVRATLPQVFAKAQMEMPQGPGEITTGSQGGFRYLQQGGKIVSSQAPDRPQTTAPVRPNWTKTDQRMPDGTVQSGVIDMNAPDPTATFKPMGAPGKAGPDENRIFARADKLRDEYNAASKELVTVADNFAKIQEVSADNSAAGDLSLIFSYMKMLDPNSVVREQEFANAQNAAGVPDRIRAAYNKVISGERLAPAQRADFIKQAGNVYNAQNKRHEATVVKRYTAMAKRWNIDPQDVIGDLGVGLPKAGGAAAPADGPPGDIDAILKKYK